VPFFLRLGRRWQLGFGALAAGMASRTQGAREGGHGRGVCPRLPLRCGAEPMHFHPPPPKRQVQSSGSKSRICAGVKTRSGLSSVWLVCVMRHFVAVRGAWLLINHPSIFYFGALFSRCALILYTTSAPLLFFFQSTTCRVVLRRPSGR
jgi:hypothetical protein